MLTKREILAIEKYRVECSLKSIVTAALFTLIATLVLIPRLSGVGMGRLIVFLLIVRTVWS